MKRLQGLEIFFPEEEVKRVVRGYELSKATPDGYNFNLIKKVLEFDQNRFCRVRMELFQIKVPSKRSNMTWVTLIPKVDDAKEIKDY